MLQSIEDSPAEVPSHQGSASTSMEMYQHDSATMFQFVLRGDLVGDRVLDLEHAWTTAKSILSGKELVVDLSGITSADNFGVALLYRMRDSGARLDPALPPNPEEFLRPSARLAAAPRGRFIGTWFLGFLISAVARK